MITEFSLKEFYLSKHKRPKLLQIYTNKRRLPKLNSFLRLPLNLIWTRVVSHWRTRRPPIFRSCFICNSPSSKRFRGFENFHRPIRESNSYLVRFLRMSCYYQRHDCSTICSKQYTSEQLNDQIALTSCGISSFLRFNLFGAGCGM